MPADPSPQDKPTRDMAFYERLIRRGSYERARSELPLGLATREVLALGLPTAVQFASETLSFVTFTTILGTLGAEQIVSRTDGTLLSNNP